MVETTAGVVCNLWPISPHYHHQPKVVASVAVGQGEPFKGCVPEGREWEEKETGLLQGIPLFWVLARQAQKRTSEGQCICLLIYTCGTGELDPGRMPGIRNGCRP